MTSWVCVYLELQLRVHKYILCHKGLTMKRYSLILTLLIVLLSSFVCSSTYGAVITIPSYITTVPNNDDFTGLGNPNNNLPSNLMIGFLGYDPSYSGHYGAGTGYDIEESGGTTEYLLAETIQNHSGTDWVGINIGLFLNLNYSRGYLSTPDDGCNFDFDPAPTSSISLSLSNTLDELYWSGLIPDGSEVKFTYSVDIPDGLGANHVWFQYAYVLAEQTPVPEPATILLLGTGLAGLAGFRRRFIKK
jgi:hypothetical protein